MEYFICGCIGYGLGCLNPAYFISKWKHKDIRKTGTGNLGTTNAFINFGKGWGCFVLLFPLIYSYKLHSVPALVILSVCSAVIIYKHMDNIKKIKAGEEIPIYQFLRNYILRRG